MSESASPGAAQPEPTPGTPAGAVEAAPAASSEMVAPVEAVAAPAVEEAPKPSLVSEAKAEPAEEVKPEAAPESKPEEPKAEEPKAEEPKEEPKAEEKPEEKKPEPRPAPVFEKYKFPDGVTVDEARVTAFNGLLGDAETRIATDPEQAHAVMQELGQKLADFHIQEIANASQAAARLNREHWDRTRENWVKEFRDDPVLGKNRADTTLSQIGALIDMYGSHAGGDEVTRLRDDFTMTGMGDTPRMIRFMNWAASRLVETRRIVMPQPTIKAPAQTPGQKLYGNTPMTRTA
jgi:hypothetical protein